MSDVMPPVPPNTGRTIRGDRPSFPARVAVRAADVQFARLLLSILAAPFYLLGLVVGLVLVAARWCWAAVLIGIEDVKKGNADAG